MRPLVAQGHGGFSEVASKSCSDTVNALVLSANTADYTAIPAGATVVIIQATASIYIKIGSASVEASIPSGNVTNGTASELNAGGYVLLPSDVGISCISPSAAKVTFAYYS